MELTYTNVNGYLIPNLTYKSGEQMEQLGKYGFLRRDYLKNHRNSTYQVMLLQDTIGEHLLEVDKAAREWEEIILKQLEKKEPLPDKEKDQMSGYDLVTDSPTKRIYEAVKRIPKGHVATYGKIAEMAGDHRMARAVGNALHKNPDPEHIPCFRVVNAKGELAGAFAFGGEDVQAELLRADGVEVINGRVDLEKYGICVCGNLGKNSGRY